MFIAEQRGTDPVAEKHDVSETMFNLAIATHERVKTLAGKRTSVGIKIEIFPGLKSEAFASVLTEESSITAASELGMRGVNIF